MPTLTNQSLLFPQLEPHPTPHDLPQEGNPELEQYFTPFWAAERMINHYFGDLTADDFVVDSGSGRGAWLAGIPAHVPCIGIEIDPALAEFSRQHTGRTVLCGDFRTIALPQQPTVVLGNPPYRRATVTAFLRRARELLPDNGRCGFLLPSTLFGFGAAFNEWAQDWSMEQDLIPRQLFPRAEFSFVFCLFRKERIRRFRGFFLFEDCAAISKASKRVKLVLTHGRPHRSAWRALIEDAIAAYHGKATREQIKDYIAPRRPSDNPYWKDRVREIINSHSHVFVETDDGVSLREAA